MLSDDWAAVDTLEGLIVKAVREGMGDSQAGDETFRDLLMEGKIAAYQALQRYEPSKGEKTTWVFQSVVRHIRRVFQNYLPAGEPLPEEGDDEGLGLVSSSVRSSPEFVITVAAQADEFGFLLCPFVPTFPPCRRRSPPAAPPLERLCVLHELWVGTPHPDTPKRD
jgi:hypothetical protein